MRILIYKRTHVGDPDREGRFGASDCMGRVRALNYDAVIGVGGIGAEPRGQGIAAKINWIGVGPSKTNRAGYRGPVVTFNRFVHYEEHGPFLHSVAPLLARRIYEGRVRYLLSGYRKEEHQEAEAIVRDALASRSRKVPPNKRF